MTTTNPEQQLIDKLHKAIGSWCNASYLVLPGPVDISHGLAKHLAKELLADPETAQLAPPKDAQRKQPRRQQVGNLTPPCDHRNEFIGTVGAGDFRTGPHCSVSTCGPCANRSAGYVELMTGEKAEPLLTFEEARKRADRKKASK
ncbi:hypothetical protein [Mycolicibacterium conceptionense]|uniref:hypothetical protein n=1 Tax=Mycolicibacterium conceptionense TaxID=451644 RepID=UPI0009BB79C4|nr:hypothetical protein [Mycolicibacterium conceptionense]